MFEQYSKSFLWMNLNWLKILLHLMKFLQKNIIKKVMGDVFLKLMFNTLNNYTDFIMIFHFYQKSRKIEQFRKLVANLHGKNEYVIHITNFKRAIRSLVSLKKVHRVIDFNWNAWLKLYFIMNTDLRKRAKMIF